MTLRLSRLLLLRRHLAFGASLRFDLFASLLLTSLDRSPAIHFHSQRLLLLFGASLRFDLFASLRLLTCLDPSTSVHFHAHLLLLLFGAPLRL